MSKKPDVKIIVATEDYVAGTGSLFFKDNIQCELWSIYVDPEYQRKGIGTALIDELERMGMLESRGKFCVRVDPKNPAIYFYKRNGYEEVGHEHVNITIPDTNISIDSDYIKLEKSMDITSE